MLQTGTSMRNVSLYHFSSHHGSVSITSVSNGEFVFGVYSVKGHVKSDIRTVKRQFSVIRKNHREVSGFNFKISGKVTDMFP